MIRKILIGCCLALIGAWQLQPATAAEYVIGIDDVLQITFWQQPSLNERVVVKSDGKITLSVIGEITAAGLTTGQLARKVVEQVSRFNRDISQAAVTVLEYNSQTVFIEGAVVAPGRYAREVIPDIWTIIKEMGGVTPVGDLSIVQLIRGGAVDPGAVLTVNVLEAVKSRDFAGLPKVYPHDIIRVPTTLGAVPSTGLPLELTERRAVYYVIGAVARPGVYDWRDNLDLLEAIALAGGSLPVANLSDVKIRAKSSNYASIYKIDVKRQIQQGSPQRYVLEREDVIVVPERSAGFLGVSFGVFRDVLTLLGTVTSTILLIDRFSE